MFERIFIAIIGAACCVATVVLLVNRYTAPDCDSDSVADRLTAEITAATGLKSLYLAKAHRVRGGLLSATRGCEVDVAEILGLVTMRDEHWLKVAYRVKRDRMTGLVTIVSKVQGPTTPMFTSPQD